MQSQTRPIFAKGVFLGGYAPAALRETWKYISKARLNAHSKSDNLVSKLDSTELLNIEA
jgi:hypothetical protein